ncbi:MAG: ion transporter [Campylobacterales bacterium]|nr:ion transporter [Campylobacterales bacterium]
MQGKITALVEHTRFVQFIMLLIILNGITMGIQTIPTLSSGAHAMLEIFDRVVIAIFTAEIVLRIYAHRSAFFKSGWSIFDFVIVAISLVPASAGFEILRILRVFRLFRLITVVPQMRKIVAALLGTIPGIASIGLLMTLIFYVFAIMATNLYGQTFPEWFGTLGASFYTLFQIMTLESWSMGIVRPIMEVHPHAWVFFVPFIFVVTFIMVNLIVAIVVDAMSALKDDTEEAIIGEMHHTHDDTAEHLQALRDEIRELKSLIQSTREG